ncbi:MAG TPA: DUF3224 domain-containing protein [Lysobacter sp.]
MGTIAVGIVVERLDARLDGRAGRFPMMHSGVMDQGAPSLKPEVVPDSADGELAGLRGSMRIDIADGEHFHAFDYALPAA